DHPELDIAFKLTFPKARERNPENRSDFEPAVITLADDQWSSERGGDLRPKPPSRDLALEVLHDEIARGHGKKPPTSEHIPPDTLCLDVVLWRMAFAARAIAASPEAAEQQFFRSSKQLLSRHLIGKHNHWVWPLR